MKMADDCDDCCVDGRWHRSVKIRCFFVQMTHTLSSPREMDYFTDPVKRARKLFFKRLYNSEDFRL